MESIYNELALNGSLNECARTGNVFSHISEVSNGTVSLFTFKDPDLAVNLTNLMDNKKKIGLCQKGSEKFETLP